ncbi:acylphosphatase [Pseudoalteromonas luteoviolacea]|uniref:acylphosphatase n=1 Tax=Pseudoalteromonas luteoviolacea TaxID=43657 RepID=UPI001B378B45|nr:acylphosphatase [Pseudoalteromonas luteoviolacea]MBQ4812875.1 acylphosphatase [Pseudoalteromonas luteoviolacea]
MKSSKFIVTGVVQGVGFRYHTKQRAVRLGLFGFAKNLPDRSVEVVVFGEQCKIDELANWLQQGPTLASVDSVREEDTVQEIYTSFEIY